MWRALQILAEGGASLIRISDVVTTTSRGVGALIQASGEKGLIEIERCEADEYSLTGQDGSVKVVDASVRDTMKVRPSWELAACRCCCRRPAMCAHASRVVGGMQASSVSGNVIMSGMIMALRASIQVETTSGSVVLKLTEFAGLVSLHSSGTITLKDETGSQWADVQKQTEDNYNTVTASVNCAAQANCAYLGQILVISKTGGITLTVDAWDQGASRRRRLIESGQHAADGE